MLEDVGGQLIAGVVTLLVSGGGVTWWVSRRDTQKDPIPKEKAAVALSESAVTIMQGVADELRAELAREREYRSGEVASLREDQAKLKQAQEAADEAHQLTRRELEETRTDVQWLRATLGVAAAYIEKLLRWARSESRPPIPPLPSDLRNLIDPSLYEPPTSTTTD